MPMILLTAALALTLATVAPVEAREGTRTVALTFDDLPLTLVDGGCDPATALAVTEKLLAGLELAQAPATGFVNAGRTCGVEPRLLRDPILEAWLEDGHSLGNHTWSHPDLESTLLEDYLEDARKGGEAVDSLLRERGGSLVWFRHPFLHAGDTPAKKAGLARFLAERGWRVAPVTVDNQEWVYAYAYHVALERGDPALADRVADAFLRHLDEAFAYFERRSREVLGREIPQVLLLHANRLNADRIDDVIGRIRARGYSVVTLDEALEDPAYERGDPWLGSGGPSWIERWAVAGGGEARQGPREDEWVSELYRRLRAERRPAADPAGAPARVQQPAAEGCVEDPERVRSAIAEASRAFSRAMERRDPATMAAQYTEDAVLLPPNGKPVSGIQGIEAFWTPRNPLFRTVRHELTTERLEVSCEVAVDLGRWRQVARRGEEAASEAWGRYLVVWRRTGEGGWKMQFDAWTRPVEEEPLKP